MTITEVTTGIAVIGAVSLLGLLLIARFSRPTLPSAERPSHSGVLRLDRAIDMSPAPASRTSRDLGARLVGILVTVAVAGAATGVGLSLLLVVSLNALSLD